MSKNKNKAYELSLMQQIYNMLAASTEPVKFRAFVDAMHQAARNRHLISEDMTLDDFENQVLQGDNIAYRRDDFSPEDIEKIAKAINPEYWSPEEFGYGKFPDAMRVGACEKAKRALKEISDLGFVRPVSVQASGAPVKCVEG